MTLGSHALNHFGEMLRIGFYIFSVHVVIIFCLKLEFINALLQSTEMWELFSVLGIHLSPPYI